jgi:hypothetical protein
MMACVAGAELGLVRLPLYNSAQAELAPACVTVVSTNFWNGFVPLIGQSMV